MTALLDPVQLVRILAPRLGLPVEKVRRLALFVSLATTLLAANIMARTAAESLFLSYAGAEALPYYFVLLGLASFPAAAAISQLIDRLPREALFRRFLLLCLITMAALRFLLMSAQTPAYFVVLVIVVLLETLTNLQFWVLVSDYFTTLEQKRATPFLALAMAAGGSLGGALANLLSRLIATQDLLLVLPFFYLVAISQLLRLERTQRPLEETERFPEEGLAETLKSLPGLVREYPIIALVAAVGFLEVMLGGLGGYLAYSIYSREISDESQLTAFLGFLKAVMSVLEVLVVFLVTRPLIRRLGVGRMNLLFPLTTFASLLGLTLIARLPMAIAVHLNSDTVARSVAGPIENLTYNAVPRRFLGRVRAISEGFIQPGGLAAAGLLLVVLQNRASFFEISVLTLAVSVLLVALGVVRGKSYLRSLTAQLRARAVDLADVGEGLTRLPPRYADDVQDLLRSHDPQTRHLGIELAARLDPQRFLDEVIELLPKLDAGGRKAVVVLLRSVRGPSATKRLRSLLDRDDETLRALALEALLANGRPLPGAELEPLLMSADEHLRGIARAAAELTDDPQLEARCRRLDLGEEGLAAVIQGARAAADRRHVPLLLEVFEKSRGSARSSALEALAELAPTGLEAVAEIARAQITAADAAVRAAAYELLGRESSAEPRLVAVGLEDSDAAVRRRAAATLGALGNAALPFIRPALGSARLGAAQAAVEACGHIRTAAAEDVIFEFLERDYQTVERNLQWLARLPSRQPLWRPLETACHDSTQRSIDRVLHVLASFGHTRTLRYARQALRGRDERLRANAVETLASLPQRRFVVPVLDFLELVAGRRDAEDSAEAAAGKAPVDVLTMALDGEDRWIRLAAVTVAKRLGRPSVERLRADPDPLVRAAAAADAASPEAVAMSRLLLLKQVTLFQDLSLDSLLALDAAFRHADYLPDEVVFEEGSVGEDFYVVLRGEVSIRAVFGEREHELARLGSGAYFGEMALFDDEPRSAACVAATACTLLVLDRSRFHSLIEQLPRLGVEICRMLSLRLRRTQRNLQAALKTGNLEGVAQERAGEELPTTELKVQF